MVGLLDLMGGGPERRWRDGWPADAGVGVAMGCDDRVDADGNAGCLAWTARDAGAAAGVVAEHGGGAAEIGRVAAVAGWADADRARYGLGVGIAVASLPLARDCLRRALGGERRHLGGETGSARPSRLGAPAQPLNDRI